MKLVIVAMMLFFTLLMSASAFSAEKASMEVQKQAEAFSLALAENEISPVGSAWHWDLIRFRTILEVGIEIPWVAELKFDPEIELHFVKK
ncbi:MAG TPA: hypothetical protein VNJ08_16060 [Bacteriovoracaceae bacterium]|nr:hypothetical protein [Bacteriovoracaceae bacterium]